MAGSLVKRETLLPDTLEDLAKFVWVGREQLTAFRAQLRAVDKLNLAKDVREQKKDEAQLLASALLDAEAKIGNLLKKIPKTQGERTELHRNGAKKFPKSKEQTIKELGFKKDQANRFEILADNEDIIEQVKTEAKKNDDLPTRSEVLRRVKEINKEERRAEEKRREKSLRTNLDIRHGDFKKVLKDVNNIDAIITDPPYPYGFIQCFSDLSLFASKNLKKDGFCVVYSGQYHLPEVIRRLSEHLTYVWTFCLYHSSKDLQLLPGTNVMCGWKPILIFSRGRKKFRFSAMDVAISEKREKDLHEWQQSESGVKHLIEVFSEPGQLVVDPFAGSGCFCKVAQSLGRHAIGAEIND